MKIPQLKVMSALISSLFVIGCNEKEPTVSADTIYSGGNIITMNDNQPSVQAIAVKDGKIIGVGDTNIINNTFKSKDTKLIDLNGKSLLPGFIDAHSHYFNSLLVANQAQVYAPPSGTGKDVGSILAAIKQYADGHKIPKGELIIAYGYDDTVMPNGRLLNRDDIDKVFPDNPVRIDHVSMHGTVLNSLALKKYGYSDKTVTPAGGIIIRKQGTNEPYGLIMETAYLPVVAQAEKMPPEQEIAATKAGQKLYAQNGITTAHEGATHLDQFQVIKRASDAGVNIIDVIAYPFITDLDKILAEYPVEQWQQYHNRFKVGGVKVTIDGSPQGRTAKFTTPYLTGGPGGEENWTGELTFPQETINKMVKKVYDLNVPLNLHANGDGAIDVFFEAHQFAANGDLTKNRNITMIHAQFSRKEQLNKFKEYKIRPSFYTLHTYYFADAHLKNRGQKQTDYISPMRDAIDIGLRPTNHTDFVVAPLDQMMMLSSAVNRLSRNSQVIGEKQRITALEGLKAMTIWAAEQYNEDINKGSLEVGKLADMVILDNNPLTVEPTKIKNIKIVETIKEGNTIYLNQ
ncbi:amidohydrolase [uncultured Photobacterium sp.]|uniref:amidohydrolase n=1 Tax=uncultured Photobacterium sp. TaxID=173973 RepID=UPI002616FC08|nr:amidohydrolase [uncultured Photobacterium sp.]